MARTHVFLLLWTFSLYKHASYGQIPMSMWRKMANITSTSQFLEEFIAPQERQGVIAQYTSVSQPNSRQGSFTNLVTGEAGCIPQEDTVSIPSDGDLNIVRWPTCTRVARCSGCCGHEMLLCAPTNMQMQPVQVLRARYPFPGAERLVVEGIEEVLLERHLACECRCRVQPQDCDANTQIYDADACRCRCRDPNQWRTCTMEQRWDEQICSCVCRDVFRCFSNELFNNNTCRCENRQIRSGASGNEVMGTTPRPMMDRPPMSTVNPCPDLRCLAGYQAQAMLGTCRCMIVHRYTSSQTALDEDKLFRVEAAEFNRFDKPRFDNDIFSSYTHSPKSRVPHIFQQFPLRQQKDSPKGGDLLSNKISTEVQHSPVEVPEVQEAPQLESPKVTKEVETTERHQTSEPSKNNHARHHVDITVTNEGPKRYSGARHVSGGPLQRRQPMVQANYGHV